MNFKRFGSLLPDNPLCGISTYIDALNLATGACTRKIKKYEITGGEDWRKAASLFGGFWINNFNNDYDKSLENVVSSRCSHYQSVANSTGMTNLQNNQLRLYATHSSTQYYELYLIDERFSSVEDFTGWLSQQYAAGTPVTVWYVLATPTTETITVPTGLSGTEEGYLNQSGTPTPTNPIYPTANEVKVWHDIPHYIHNTSTDTLTTLPADIYANDTTATVGLKGDMEQSGTPTPQNPITPSECGDLETNGEKAGQYKIPILNNSTTTPVYLGEVESTRRIKKLVLTGQENWTKFMTSNRISFYINVSNGTGNEIVSTHFRKSQDSSFPELSSIVYNGNSNKNMIFRLSDDTTITDVDEYKLWLSDQYAAGTPVCVWYILATPETGIVNEALRKIGDYADEVSGITIPTIAGANTLSIGTTLQPSEVTATYKGWHPVADVHVYPDSSWLPTSWEEFRKAVRSGKAQSLYPVGTKLYENWGDETSDAWIVVDYPTGEDYLDSDLAQQGYTNRVMLMEEKLNYLRQFDAIEAWLYVETAIPAGTYRFTIPNYDASYGGNKTYIFTSTADVPVGGQLTLTWAYNTNPTKVQGYSSSTSTSALFDVTIAEWDGTTACTDLGTIKLAQNDADSTYGKLNHIHRARYGSNNYYQSGYRQWLNTNASANWWTPTNVFDRPYGNRTNAGRLNVMNSNMKSVLAAPTVNCITNNLFEYPSLDGTTFSLQTAYTVTDKLFPVTHSEINLSSSPNVNSVLDYYVDKGNADRIKYRKDNGNAYYWWLRTPNPTNATSVRLVTLSGALYYSSAYYTYGSAAACIIQ